MSDPIRRVLSDRVTLVYGFSDGHLDIEVKVAVLPFPVKLSMDEMECVQAIEALGEAFNWNQGRKKNA